jgi:hypothetical protein
MGLRRGKGNFPSMALFMRTLTTISILVGVVLGLRFNLLILAPTIGLALTMVAVTGVARGDGDHNIPSRERFGACHRSR